MVAHEPHGVIMSTETLTAPARVRAIRLGEVINLTGVSRPTVWRWVKDDRAFPKPFHLSPSITAWDEGEVIAWLKDKKAKRGAA